MPNFVRSSLSTMRKSHLKSTKEGLSDVLKNMSSDFMFGEYYFRILILWNLRFINLLYNKLGKNTRKPVYYLF